MTNCNKQKKTMHQAYPLPLLCCFLLLRLSLCYFSVKFSRLDVGGSSFFTIVAMKSICELGQFGVVIFFWFFIKEKGYALSIMQDFSISLSSSCNRLACHQPIYLRMSKKFLYKKGKYIQSILQCTNKAKHKQLQITIRNSKAPLR